jgi:hypothetical protein
VKGVIPSARRHTPVILLGDDRVCDGLLERHGILLEKAGGCTDGDSDLLGVWNVGFEVAGDAGKSAEYEFKSNSNVFRSGEWFDDLGCCTVWKPKGYGDDPGVNGDVEKLVSLRTGEDVRGR